MKLPKKLRNILGAGHSSRSSRPQINPLRSLGINTARMEESIWREPEPTPPPDPNAGYDAFELTREEVAHHTEWSEESALSWSTQEAEPLVPLTMDQMYPGDVARQHRTPRPEIAPQPTLPSEPPPVATPIPTQLSADPEVTYDIQIVDDDEGYDAAELDLLQDDERPLSETILDWAIESVTHKSFEPLPIQKQMGAGSDSITFSSNTSTSAASGGGGFWYRWKALRDEEEGGSTATTPSAPTVDSVTTASEQITVNFTEGDDGGTPIVDYEYSTDGGTTFVSAGTTTSPIVITGLTNGTSYDVQVRPVNALGAGDATPTVTVTPSTIPSQPTIDSTVEGDGQVTVNLTPGSDGGSPITDYEYSLDGGNTYISAGTATSPIVITGLTNGTLYNIQVRPVNANGPGTASTSFSATPSTTPSAATIDSIATGDQQLTVNFTPGSDGGAAVTNYEYSLNGGSTFVALDPADVSSPLTITGLSNGTEYDVQIRPVNANGTGPASNTVSATPSTTPSAATIDSVVNGDQQLTVNFTPGSDGGAAITDYEYSLDGGAFVSGGTTSSPLTIPGLSNGTSYDVQIRPVNANGSGPASNTVSGTPSTTPSAPTVGTVTEGNGEVSVEFTPGSDGGAAITDYEYTIDGGNNWISIGSTVSPLVISPLTNGVTYTIQIRPVNANGAGEASASFNATPTADSWAPDDVSVAAWIDASDTDSYTLSGATLTAVTDKAGTYTMVVGGDPTRVTAGLNGLNVFDFSGANEYLQSSTFSPQVSSGNHWAIGVFLADTTDSNQDSLWSYETNQSPKRDYAVSSGASNNTWPGELDLDALSSGRISTTIGNKQLWDSGMSMDNWHIVVVVFNKTGNQIAQRLDGADIFTPVNDYDNSVSTNQQLRLMRNRSSQELDGRLAEFFSVNSIPGTGGTDITDVEKAEGYLAHKWGLTGLLPSGHPYKSSPPTV